MSASAASADADKFLQEARGGAPQLVRAICVVYGDFSEMEIVKLLRESGLDVNVRGQDGVTALALACCLDIGLDVCRILLRCGAHVNARSLHGLTALHYAIAQGKEQICRLLIASGADLGATEMRYYPDASSELGPYVGHLSPLVAAVGSGRVDLCTLLLESGARPDRYCFRRCVCPTDEEISKEVRLEMLRVLIRAADSLPEEERSPLIQRALLSAARRGKEDMCRLLLTEGRARPNELSVEDDTPLVAAANKGHIEVCKAILDAGVKPDDYCDRCMTPLHVIAATNQHDVCELFLRQPGVNVDVQTADEECTTPLLEAAGNRSSKMAKLFIKYGANVHAKCALLGRTTLHRAARHGCVDTLRVLVDAGASVTERATNGDAPIHAAARGGNAEACKLLLETGLVSVHDRGNGGKTPLHMAAQHQNGVECSKVFVEAKADVNARCDKGRTPLHVAAEFGSEESCRQLITAGASVSERDNAGYQPLHLAAGASCASICKLFLEYGADPRARTSQGGFTPMHQAGKISYGGTAVFAALLEAGGPAALEDLDGRGYNCLQLAAKVRNGDGARRLLNAGARFPAAVLADGGAGAAAGVGNEEVNNDNLVDSTLGLTRPASSLHERWDRRLAFGLSWDLASLLEGNSTRLSPEHRGFLRWAASLPREVLLGAFTSRCGRHAVPRCFSDPTWSKQRKKLVSALEKDAWERRKPLVTWYFGERRRRQETAGTDNKSPDAPPAVVI